MHQVDERRLQREKEAKDSRTAPPPLSSSSVASIGSIRDVGRSNGIEISYNNVSSPAPTYQRTTFEGAYNPTSMQKNLIPTSKESVVVSFQNEKNGFHSSGRKESNNFQQNSGLALGLDVTTEKELKRKKQQEYKQQLDMLNKDKVDQQSPRAFPGTRNDSQVSLNIYTGGNGTPQRMDRSTTPYIDQGSNYNTGYQEQERRQTQTQNAAPYLLANGGDKTSRRLKQEEYKRELDLQMYERATKASNDAEPQVQYNISTDPRNKEVNRNVQQRQQEFAQPYHHEPARPVAYENAHGHGHGGQQYYPSEDVHYPSQSEMDNDPHFQAYLRRKNEDNPPHFQRETTDYPNDYGGKTRSDQPPLYSKGSNIIMVLTYFDHNSSNTTTAAVSDQPPSSSAMLSPGQPSRMKLVAEVYGYGSNPLLGDGSSANNNSHRTGQQKSSANNQKALLDQQVKKPKYLFII